MLIVVLSAAAVVLVAWTVRPRPRARGCVGQVAVPMPVAGAVTPPAARATAWRPRRACEAALLAGWCDALSWAVRGGATLHAALATTAVPSPLAAALEPVQLGLARGQSVSRVLADVTHTSSELELILVVLKACADHGGAPAEPIDRAASALRQRAARRVERQTQSAQARMSAGVMTLLPAALLLTLLGTSGPVRSVAASVPGAIVIAFGLALNLAGWRWMRRLIDGPRRRRR